MPELTLSWNLDHARINLTLPWNLDHVRVDLVTLSCNLDHARVNTTYSLTENVLIYCVHCKGIFFLNKHDKDHHRVPFLPKWQMKTSVVFHAVTIEAAQET